jgi:hypothetical protein
MHCPSGEIGESRRPLGTHEPESCYLTEPVLAFSAPQPRERSPGPRLNRWGFFWLFGESYSKATPGRGRSSLRNDRSRGFAFSNKAAAEAKARKDDCQRKRKPFHESDPFLRYWKRS